MNTFIPDYVFKRYNKQPSKAFVCRSKQFPLKRTTINYSGLTVEPLQEEFMEKKEEKCEKPSCFEEFVN